MLVLLDLDGTLTDPYDGITKSVSNALDRMGLPRPELIVDTPAELLAALVG